MAKADKKRLKREREQELFKARDKRVRDLGYNIYPNFFMGKKPMSYTYKKDGEKTAYGWDHYESVLLYIERKENLKELEL